jgi:hypothetical protein
MHCTNSGQGLVNRLHSLRFKADTDAAISLTAKLAGVKP